MRTYRQADHASSIRSMTRPTGAFTVAVIIPAARAAISGLALGICAGLVAWGVGYGGDSLGIGAMVGAFGFLGAWGMGTRQEADISHASGDYDHAIDAPPPGGPSRLVLVNPKASADPDRAARFSEFVQACERDSSTRRLRGLGYSDGEITGFRDSLLRLDWARWNARDKRGGWRLTSPAEDVLEAMA